MTDNIVKTEVVLSEESVKQIVIAESAKAISNIPGFMEGLVKTILFTRPPKKYSYDKPKPTYYEKLIGEVLKPIIQEEAEKLAESWRPKVKVILKKAFKTNVLDNKEFENRIIERLSKFSSNISFYINE